MTTTIPASMNQVTPTWLTEVLHRSSALGPDAKAVIVQPSRIGEGAGLMGELHRVELSYEGVHDDAPTSVVVKLPSSFEENRQQGINLGMYESEVRFYDELAERTGTGLPRIHVASINSGTAEFVIVMEDLSSLELVDQAQGISTEQAGAALRVLADVHATWWDRVQTDELEWIPTMTGPRIEMIDAMLAELWPLFFDRFGDQLPPGGAELGAAFSTHYLALMQTLADRSPWTLAHQDTRAENLMFGDPGRDEVTIIDWQGIGRGPGAYDVAYCLGGSLPTDARREHEGELLVGYHQRLVERGVTDYTLNQARADYGLAHGLGGLATSVFAGATLDLANQRGYELICTMADRHFTAALDHNCLGYME